MSQKNNILIVEDNTLLALMIESALESAGFSSFTTCGDNATALKKMDETHFSFAFLDFNLGDQETSSPVANRLTTLGVPFVFITGYSKSTGIIPEDLQEVGRINKPFKISEVLSYARTYLAPAACPNV